MRKRLLLGAFLLVLVVSIGLFSWARAVFAQENVRAALAAQLSKALGQPVTVGSISATIYPRVTVILGQVGIGDPARIQVQTLRVGTDFRALLSRRIEHASLELSGARVELPLPAFFARASFGGGSSGGAPLEIVSVDDVMLRGIEIVSGGRTLTGDVEVVPKGRQLTLRNVTFGAGTATIHVTGQIADVSGPVGVLAIKAGALNLDQLLAFATDFAAGAGIGATTAARSAPGPATSPAVLPAGAPPMQIAATLEADRATIGTLTLDGLASRVRITSRTIAVEPASFRVFGGRFDGSLVVTLGAVPEYRLGGVLSGADMAAVTAFGGNPGTITGRMSGRINLTGRGTNVLAAMNEARGTARLDAVDGVVRNLGLVRTVLVATSGRAGGGEAAGGRDEPFTELGATLTIAGHTASTQNLRFDSKDVSLTAAGTTQLDGSALHLTGLVQLSDELSRQAGRDLVRYTQEGGRVTLPVTIAGSADAPHVQVDVAGVAERALTNAANEELRKAMLKGLSGLFKK
jgi:uncharacterized protein involved in outer membrane biogenesis